MNIFLAIRPKPDGPPLSYEAWCRLVKKRPQLVPAEPVVGKNPKTGEPMTIYPRPDSASIVFDGRKVGGVHWSLSGDENE